MPRRNRGAWRSINLSTICKAIQDSATLSLLLASATPYSRTLHYMHFNTPRTAPQVEMRILAILLVVLVGLATTMAQTLKDTKTSPKPAMLGGKETAQKDPPFDKLHFDPAVLKDRNSVFYGADVPGAKRNANRPLDRSRDPCPHQDLYDDHSRDPCPNPALGQDRPSKTYIGREVTSISPQHAEQERRFKNDEDVPEILQKVDKINRGKLALL